MKLQIEHETIFTYSGAVSERAGEARVRPRDEHGQRCLSFKLSVEPQAPVDELTDDFGNTVHCYSILPAHRRCVIVATSVVETTQQVLIPAANPHLLERHDALAPSRYAFWTPAIEAFAREHAGEGSDEDRMLALKYAIYEHFDYVPGSTDISTTADEVLQGRKGVCQDFAHLLIACCRCIGIPARYVSGYLYDRSNGPYDVLATHAWVEAYSGQGWLGLDPTHRRMVTDHYVRIAIGRDYADAAPVRGFYKGTAKEKMSVTVRIRPLEEPVIAP
ncbi:MAG: transglutaminase family protein [Anaerolineae bacterium]